jgi:hypothetical protein
MNSSPRIPPRFVPTLTEIVHAPDGARPDAGARAIAGSEDALAPRLDPLIEKQVRELVIALVAEQLESLRAGLRVPGSEPDAK